MLKRCFWNQPKESRRRSTSLKSIARAIMLTLRRKSWMCTSMGRKRKSRRWRAKLTIYRNSLRTRNSCQMSTTISWRMLTSNLKISGKKCTNSWCKRTWSSSPWTSVSKSKTNRCMRWGRTNLSERRSFEFWPRQKLTFRDHFSWWKWMLARVGLKKEMSKQSKWSSSNIRRKSKSFAVQGREH